MCEVEQISRRAFHFPRVANISNISSLKCLTSLETYSLIYIDGTNRPRQARPPPRQAALPSYFPAQKSELHFLIEPSNIRETAPGCRHRRIDELWNGGCSAIQGRIAGVYS